MRFLRPRTLELHSNGITVTSASRCDHRCAHNSGTVPLLMAAQPSHALTLVEGPAMSATLHRRLKPLGVCMVSGTRATKPNGVFVLGRDVSETPEVGSTSSDVSAHGVNLANPQRPSGAVDRVTNPEAVMPRRALTGRRLRDQVRWHGSCSRVAVAGL